MKHSRLDQSEDRDRSATDRRVHETLRTRQSVLGALFQLRITGPLLQEDIARFLVVKSAPLLFRIPGRKDSIFSPSADAFLSLARL